MKMNNKGFTLTEVLIASAIMGATALVMTKYFSNFDKGQKSFESRMELTYVEGRVRDLLSQSTLCASSLKSSSGGPIYLGNINSSELPSGTTLSGPTMASPITIQSIEQNLTPILKNNLRFGGYVVEKMSLNKFLNGSNQTQNFYRMNLEVEFKSKKNMFGAETRLLNFDLSIMTDPNQNNKIETCRLGLLSLANSSGKLLCTNLGYDATGFGTAVCAGTGVTIVKTANGNNSDNGIAGSSHIKTHYPMNKVNGCENMDYDGANFGTAVCWGDGLFLVKTSNGNNSDGGNGQAWHVKRHFGTEEIIGCKNMGEDGANFGTAVCWGKGVYLVKTSNGNNSDQGINDSWHIVRHFSGEVINSCENLGYDATGYGTASCQGVNGVFLVKTSNGDNADRGNGSTWHVVKHSY